MRSLLVPVALRSTAKPNLYVHFLVRSLSSSSHDRKYDSGPLHDRYYAMVNAAELEKDPIQLKALQSLERLRHELLTQDPPTKVLADPNQPITQSSSLLSSWKPSWMATSNTSNQWNAPAASSTIPRIRGTYLCGGVGCGKTFLMNQIFYDSITEGPWKDERRKTHFHKFMLRIHAEMHAARYQDNTDGNAILPAVIAKEVSAGRLLCFDEFQVTDVADALILQRLFTGLWQHGCVVVATSNRPPDDLYLNGLQRDRFVPFIHELQKHCEVVNMFESETDYRLMLKGMDNAISATGAADGSRTPKLRKVYYQGGKDAWKEFDKLFYDMAGPVAVAPTSLTTQGRRVAIPQAALAKGIARFAFEDLCEKALGAADYLVIGQNFHTVFVEKIPVLTLAELNWVRRFIIFVDSMYECHCKLILHAQTDARGIFQPDAKTQDDEVFAFDRTVSRLEEMSSQKYLQKQQPHEEKAESKASLLSQRKAVVNVFPSLGDSVSMRSRSGT